MQLVVCQYTGCWNILLHAYVGGEGGKGRKRKEANMVGFEDAQVFISFVSHSSTEDKILRHVKDCYCICKFFTESSDQTARKYVDL
ncbi:hypothetical protein MUK42_35513 [Musa troglodytarum]|uniref:Uncharacterized protein n=1 Tax=Musa troglodytarum TaxID=320322 RepID=A0A9E7EE85_9LILI|nr:hypothetical protein MUK42_35513 [Musa troglodytarum]